MSSILTCGIMVFLIMLVYLESILARPIPFRNNVCISMEQVFDNFQYIRNNNSLFNKLSKTLIHQLLPFLWLICYNSVFTVLLGWSYKLLYLFENFFIFTETADSWSSICSAPRLSQICSSFAYALSN